MMSVLRILFKVVLVAAWLGAGIVDAQEERLVLDLTKALELSGKVDLNSQIAALRSAQAQNRRTQARAALLPQAELRMAESVERYNLRAQIGVQFPEVPHSIGPFQDLRLDVQFSQVLFNLDLIRRYQQAGHTFAAERANESTVREQAALLVVSEYLEHQRSKARGRAADARITLAQRLSTQAHDLLLAGLASRIDLSRADTRLSEEKQSLLDANLDADRAVFALKRLLRVPGETQIVFADPDIPVKPDAAIAHVGMDQVFRQRSEVIAAQEQVRAARLGVLRAQADVLPQLEASGRWGQQGATFNQFTPAYSYELHMRVPLFTSDRLRSERAEAANKAGVARLSLLREQDSVTEEVQDAEAELVVALAQTELGREQVALANSEVSMAEGRFAAGITDNIEVISAQDALARANELEIAARYRYALTQAQLARAQGRLQELFGKP